MARKLPFESQRFHSQIEKDVIDGKRPEIPPQCPAFIASLMQRCWAQEPNARPTMAEVLEELEPMVRYKTSQEELQAISASRLAREQIKMGEVAGEWHRKLVPKHEGSVRSMIVVDNAVWCSYSTYVTTDAGKKKSYRIRIWDVETCKVIGTIELEEDVTFMLPVEGRLGKEIWLASPTRGVTILDTAVCIARSD